MTLLTHWLQMLLTACPTWCPARLMALPRHYEVIFDFYRRRPCSVCNSLPDKPAVCLVCGQLVCHQGRCCEHNGVQECVQVRWPYTNQYFCITSTTWFYDRFFNLSAPKLMLFIWCFDNMFLIHKLPVTVDTDRSVPLSQDWSFYRNNSMQINHIW